MKAWRPFGADSGYCRATATHSRPVAVNPMNFARVGVRITRQAFPVVQQEHLTMAYSSPSTSLPCS